MRTAGARFTVTDPAYAGYFRLAGFMRRMASAIFCRQMPVKRASGRRKRSVSGLICRTERSMSSFFLGGIVCAESLHRHFLGEQSDETKKALNLFVLRLFFLTPYDAATDFYEQFYERAAKVERLLAES